jgi:hypothetical protein
MSMEWMMSIFVNENRMKSTIGGRKMKNGTVQELQQ